MSKIFKLILIFFVLNFQTNTELFSKAEKKEEVPEKEKSEKSSKIYTIAAVGGGIVVIAVLGKFLAKANEEYVNKKYKRLQDECDEENRNRKPKKPEVNILPRGEQEVKFTASFEDQRFEGMEEILEVFQRAKDDPVLCSRNFEISRFYRDKNYVGDQVVYGPERGGRRSGVYIPKDHTVEELRGVLESFGAKNWA